LSLIVSGATSDKTYLELTEEVLTQASEFSGLFGSSYTVRSCWHICNAG